MDGKRNSKEGNQEWEKYEKFDFDSEMMEWKKNVISYFMEEGECNRNKREKRKKWKLFVWMENIRGFIEY